MNRLFLAVGGVAVAGTAAVALGTGSGNADPGNSTLNVVGEPYAKAVAILRAQGVPTVFGGAVGDGLPQPQCIVSSQKVLGTRKMSLMLDCSSEAAPQRPATAPASGAPATSGAPVSQTARPTPGAPGVVTVIPTPVG